LLLLLLNDRTWRTGRHSLRLLQNLYLASCMQRVLSNDRHGSRRRQNLLLLLLLSSGRARLLRLLFH
jgi:hypothetical protein